MHRARTGDGERKRGVVDFGHGVQVVVGFESGLLPEDLCLSQRLLDR